MSTASRNQFSAPAPALGYLYQVRLSLLEAIKRLRKGESFSLTLETLDDVVFEKDGTEVELLQTKHHIGRHIDITDASVDLWKTIRVWSEASASGTIPDDTLRYLITTAGVSTGHASKYLTRGSDRDVTKAIERLDATATTSQNKTNAEAYTAYKALSATAKKDLFKSVFIIDCAPNIHDLESELMEALFFAVDGKHMSSFLLRVEGWWYQRAIKQLKETPVVPILSAEVNAQLSELRDQFKQDSLPIDDDIMRASVDASGYQDWPFVLQLQLIDIGNPRILHAVRNYYRAYTQRSRWVREDLLLVGELDKYEQRLVEEWEILFEQMKDTLGDAATETLKKAAAQDIYRWIETAVHVTIRTGVTEPSIPRGTYQMLSNSLRLGWHPDFANRIDQVLKAKVVSP